MLGFLKLIISMFMLPFFFLRIIIFTTIFTCFMCTSLMLAFDTLIHALIHALKTSIHFLWFILFFFYQFWSFNFLSFSILNRFFNFMSRSCSLKLLLLFIVYFLHHLLTLILWNILWRFFLYL
jgi:hypothetical protein